MIYSTVLVLPKDQKDAGNAVAVALGHDVAPGNTYSVALSPSGSAPATHYGCHTWARPEFIAQLQAAEQGSAPEIPGVDMPTLMSVLVKSVMPEGANPVQHFMDVLKANGLTRIEEL